jgi:hypothetical protein
LDAPANDPATGEVPQVTEEKSQVVSTTSENTVLLDKIKTLYSKYPMPSSKDEIELLSEKVLTTPFQTVTKGANTFIALPSNYEEMVEDNLFFQILNKLIVDGVYSPVTIDKTFTPRLKLGSAETTFLKAFYYQTFSNTMIKLPTRKSQLYHGLMSAQKIILSAIPDLDISLYKQKSAKLPSTVIFGDPYGKNYPVEKKILDKMIHTMRTNKINCEFFCNLIPLNEIIKDKGLKVDTSSDLLSEDEKAAAKSLLRDIGQFELPDESDFKSERHAIDFQKSIRDFQKKVKVIKIGINTIVSERITACFAPYSGSARIKAKKEKISTLIDNAKSDSVYYKAFNPSMVNLLVGRPRQITQFPEAWGNDRITGFMDNFVNLLLNDFDQVIADNIAATYFRYLQG